MSCSLIIGFKYHSENKKEFSSIIVDLYHAYKYAKRLGGKIYIITDLITDENSSFVITAIREKVVQADVISFISNIKKNKEHLEYGNFDRNQPNRNVDNFVENIISVVRGKEELFIYYTGHAHNKYLSLPYYQKLEFNIFRDCIVQNCNPDANIFCIMDCCNGADMGISFVFEDDRYRLVEKERRKFFSQKIIHIVSSQQDQGTVLDGEQGSLFTNEIFACLREGKRGFKHLIQKVNKNCKDRFNELKDQYPKEFKEQGLHFPPKACLYSTRPNIYTLNECFSSQTKRAEKETKEEEEERRTFHFMIHPVLNTISVTQDIYREFQETEIELL